MMNYLRQYGAVQQLLPGSMHRFEAMLFLRAQDFPGNPREIGLLGLTGLCNAPGRRCRVA